MAKKLSAGGVVPMMGLTDAIAAARIASLAKAPHILPPVPVGPDRASTTITEAEAKAKLAEYGVPVPRGIAVESASDLPRAAENLRQVLQ